MKTVTVKLPPNLDTRLERLAAQLGKTKSILIRLALEELFKRPDLAGKLSAYELVAEHCGILEGLPRDLSSSDKQVSDQLMGYVPNTIKL